MWGETQRFPSNALRFTVLWGGWARPPIGLAGLAPPHFIFVFAYTFRIKYKSMFFVVVVVVTYIFSVQSRF